jgi:hypothetical protein
MFRDLPEQLRVNGWWRSRPLHDEPSARPTEFRVLNYSRPPSWPVANVRGRRVRSSLHLPNRSFPCGWMREVERISNVGSNHREQIPAGRRRRNAGRLGVDATGPTTLNAGLSGTYTVSVANNGDAGASAEVFVNFAGRLDQTDPVTPSDGFDSTVRRADPGVNATVRCPVQQLAPHTTPSIVVHGRGISAGPGQLVTLVNSDPGVGFDNKTQHSTSPSRSGRRPSRSSP